ncbi:uncharacterized protein LOC116127037 [Pistacia vera]|uniref:uncharacterized protein LOC116127037 n=1 Tax=Pistacia vera TaxID=55513 RepID=UPI001263A184|nr:uncharacterized protein LOC116127037 [Pistacia vera]
MKKIQQSVVPERHIVQNNPSLKMFSIMVNRLIPNKQIVRVQTDDNLFGYDSYTYLTKEDFERVLNMEELTASCITVYIMALYEKLKVNGGYGNGFGFMNPNALSIAGSNNVMGTRTQRAQLLANQLAIVKNENLILIPYNPGFIGFLLVLI